GTWWYRSIRYSGDQILINTTQLFMHFMYKTPNMNMKRESRLWADPRFLWEFVPQLKLKNVMPFKGCDGLVVLEDRYDHG
ncbi:unnamed protein product, partial [Boreogadus saida]